MKDRWPTIVSRTLRTCDKCQAKCLYVGIRCTFKAEIIILRLLFLNVPNDKSNIFSLFLFSD